jgi:hypothetical protein
MATEYGKLVDEICNSTGKYIRVETSDGVNREGKLTKIELRKFTYNGRAVCLPSGIELNDDPQDVIQLDRIAKMSIR